MSKSIILVCVLAVMMSCKDTPKEATPNQKKETIVTNSDDFLVFENKLVKKDIENAEYSNISFKENGAVFSRDLQKPTYVRIPFSDIDFSKEFNVSFSFSTAFGDGRKPQSLLAFVNSSSSTFRVPLYIYLPRNKLSGVYGNQHLYYEDYNKNNSESKVFKSSKMIGVDKLYFVSVNHTVDGVIQIFVNSELYATFNNLEPHNLESTDLIIGTIIQNNKPGLPLEGTIYGIKIFNKALNEKEITKIFNSLPMSMEY